MNVDKIKQDLQKALKEGDSLKVSTLRLVLSAVEKQEKEKRYKEKKEASLSQDQIVEIIASEAKKRKESIKSFELGGRDDLVDKEKKELAILKEYLPQEMTEQELISIIKKAIIDVNAQGLKDINKVMPQVMPQVKGRADGSIVSQKVKQELENFA
jgi:uncharacterized protein